MAKRGVLVKNHENFLKKHIFYTHIQDIAFKTGRSSIQRKSMSLGV